jgi:hypothetical protein
MELFFFVCRARTELDPNPSVVSNHNVRKRDGNATQ